MVLSNLMRTNQLPDGKVKIEYEILDDATCCRKMGTGAGNLKPIKPLLIRPLLP